MLKACVKAVYSLCKNLGKVLGLSTLSTVRIKYLTSQVFFVRNLSTALRRLPGAYEQSISSIFNLLDQYLYPLYTGPINTTNLIKE